MKLRMITLLVILIPLLWLAACKPSTSSGTLVVGSCDAFNSQPHRSTQIAVAAGDTFAVTLCSNATTGFQWPESAQISDQTVVQQTGHKFMPPENTGVVGAPGNDVWTFKALKKGASTITMEYSRPWEGGEKGVWTFSLAVTVN